MSNRQQFVQQYSENDMVLKVRARDRRRARTTLATVSRGSFRPSRTTLPLTRPDRSFRLFRENERAQELERLEDDANVYKLIGPVLIKQDLVEAKSNVEKRLEFIQNETERLDKMVKSMENKQETKHREILELQKKLQTLAAAK